MEMEMMCATFEPVHKTKYISSLMLFFPSFKVDHGVAWPSFNQAIENNAMEDSSVVK